MNWKGVRSLEYETEHNYFDRTRRLDWSGLLSESCFFATPRTTYHHREVYESGPQHRTPQRMAPLARTSSPARSLSKRELPNASFIGIAAGVGVFLIILISLALWCYIRGWRLPGRGQSRLDSDNESSPTGPERPRRASKYWSADDVGKSAEKSSEVQVTEVFDTHSKRESHVVVLPTPSMSALGFATKRQHRQSPIVRLPTPSLISVMSEMSAKDQKPAPTRPAKGRLPVFSRHVSMQFVDISEASSTTSLNRTPALDDFPKPGSQWGRVTDWQSHRH